MLKLKLSQHAQILGFAIIGYGTSQIISTIGTAMQVWYLTGQKLSATNTDFLAPSGFSAIIYFLVSLYAGTIIKGIELDPKIPSLVFVFLAIGVFPLGTILSVYVLIYLFVIYPNGYEEDHLNSRTLGEEQ